MLGVHSTFTITSLPNSFHPPVTSLLLKSTSCPQHPVLKHTVHPICIGVLWRHVVWYVGPKVRVNILVPLSICQCCGRTHYLHVYAMIHRDTLPPHAPGYVGTTMSVGGRGSTRWRSWLRHCATSHKVGGSIPDVVTEIFL